jgi:N-acetylglucosaminyldiphosphoundecaprenol N-acetyl-beta-D-mannosaminyltransferase
MDDVVAKVGDWITEAKRSYVCVTGVHGVMASQKDPELRRIHNCSGLTVPDGRPMVWCGRYVGSREMSQVRGSDLLLAVTETAEQEGWPVFFYGGGEGTPELLANRLTERFPKLIVAGTMSPPFRELTEDEDQDAVVRINGSGAKIVWVGLSTPKQERWMASHIGRLEAPVLFGVGAAFDLNAGLKSPAPQWLQSMGLEWFYRLCQEPRRLWRRYLVNNPRFIAAVLRRPPRLRRRMELI